MRNVQSISVTIPNALAERLNKVQKEEMKSCSSVVTEALREYVDWQQFKKLQRELSAMAKAKKIVSADDVDRIIHDLR